MSAYYLHDGRNEIGPFSIDLLRKQKLTRNTPIRQLGSDNWLPAEKLAPLKELVAPRKIKKPKDVIPAVKEHLADWQQRKPRLLYGILLLLALIAGVSIYSITKTHSKALPQVTVFSHPQVAVSRPAAPAEPVKPAEEKKLPVVAEDKAKTARSRWNKLISATNSNYGIGFLGGIKDLSVIVSNRTDFPIDVAVVKVTYIKANGGTWKTVPITIYGVPPHDSKEQSVPDVGRGKKVKVNIQKLVSKKMNFSYTEGQKVRNPDDPYVL